MGTETRSLWEQLDSEVEPWRKGRSFLVAIGAFQFLSQLVVLTATMLIGAVETTCVLAVGFVIFWFLFYFVWIGVHWVRWLWGGWHLIVGFCLFIWGWRDSNSIQLTWGLVTSGIGFLLIFSSSIYFFARRQRESVRWLEAVLMGALCLFLVGVILTALVGFIVVRESWRRSATAFAMEANRRIYQEPDYDWIRAHVSERSVGVYGEERLHNFFLANQNGLGRVNAFENPTASIVVRIIWPSDVRAVARIDCWATSARGPLVTHEIISGNPADWRLERMWWEWVPFPLKK